MISPRLPAIVFMVEWGPRLAANIHSFCKKYCFHELPIVALGPYMHVPVFGQCVIAEVNFSGPGMARVSAHVA